MTEDATMRRGWKSLGFAGPIGFLLVYAAASLDAVFDWRVFGLSLAALLLCWARTWILMPVHYRIVEKENAEWDRYNKNDWHLIELLASLSGQELDRLRDDVASADNDKVAELMNIRAPSWTEVERRRSLKHFVEDLSNFGQVYVDESGTIRQFD